MSSELVTTPQFDLSAIEKDPNLADSTKYKYRREIDRYLVAGHNLGDVDVLAEYASQLPSSRRAFLKSAIRKVVEGYELRLKAGATPENIDTVQAALMRFEAIQDTIKVRNSKGKKAHTWLSQSEVRELMIACDSAGDELTYLRDWVILGLLVGAGLRREELVDLTFGDFKTMPANGNGDRDVIEVKGKGARGRVVPIKSILAERVEEWRQMIGAGPSNLIARSLGRGKNLGDSISAVGIFKIVRKYGKKIGRPDLAPHDLRRTYAQLGFDAGVPITQISILLGHENVATTQRYLDLDLDLVTTVSDFIPLE